MAHHESIRKLYPEQLNFGRIKQPLHPQINPISLVECYLIASQNQREIISENESLIIR